MEEKDIKRIIYGIADLAEECNRMSGRIDRLWSELKAELFNKDNNNEPKK